MDVEGSSVEPTAQLEPDGAPRLSDLAQLADALVEEIAAARSHYEGLREALEQADREAKDEAPAQLETEGTDDPQPAAPEPDPPQSPPAEPVAHHSADPPPEDKARLEAMSLALTGGTREDALALLHDDFGLDDPSDIVDEVFGPVPAEDLNGFAIKRRFRRQKKAK